jgi:hypothetical protein
MTGWACKRKNNIYLHCDAKCENYSSSTFFKDVMQSRQMQNTQCRKGLCVKRLTKYKAITLTMQTSKQPN